MEQRCRRYDHAHVSMLQVHLLCTRRGDLQKRQAHPLRKGCGPCNACCHDKPGTCRAGTLYRSTLAHIVNTCLSSCWPSGSFLDTTLSGTKPCYRDVQALPRRVLGPSVAPPARGLPSRAGSATPTPAAPPPGECLVQRNCRVAQLLLLGSVYLAPSPAGKK